MCKLEMPFAKLEVALRIASQFAGMVVLQAQDGTYIVTENNNVKKLKRDGYIDVREEKSGS